MAAGMVYLMLVGPWLLPDRRGAELSETYELGKYITELRVMEGLAADRPERGRGAAGREARRVRARAAARRGEDLVAARAAAAEGDVLLARGDWQKLSALKDEARLELEPEFTLRDAQFRDAEQVLTEVMVAPGSRLIGHTLAELDFQWHYNATALAIHRRGEVLRDKLKDVRLTVGDVLLLVTSPDEMRALRGNRNLVVLSEREEAGGNRRRAWMSIAIMVAVVGVACRSAGCRSSPRRSWAASRWWCCAAWMPRRSTRRSTGG
jgi:uncharacterized protein with PhoU and TrkA domain